MMHEMRIVVTGTKEDAHALAARLEKDGLSATALPTISIKKKTLSEASADALRNIADYDYILFASPHAVSFFADALRDLWIKRPSGIRIAAVGPVTARALREIGLEPTIVPRDPGTDGLTDELKNIDGKKILFPRSATASDDAVETLQSYRATVTVVPLYTTTPLAAGKYAFQALFGADNVPDRLVFLSPSSVAGFAKNLPGTILTERIREVPVLAIGPTTVRAAKDAGFERVDIARPSTIDGIIKTLLVLSKKTDITS